MEQSLGHDAVSLSLKEYVHSVKPITVEKVRKQRPADSLDEKKIAKLRSLLGALAWPATQAPPMLSAAASLLQASMARPTIADILEANKTLVLPKSVRADCAQPRLRRPNLVLGVCTDAAWAGDPMGHHKVDTVGPSYAWAPSLMSSFRAYSGSWVCLGTLFNVKFWGQNL